MKKEETIRRYGEATWEKRLEQRRAYYKAHKEAENAYNKKYKDEHPEKTKEATKKYREEHREEITNWREEHKEEQNKRQNQKGGKYYDKMLEDSRIGLRGARKRIRSKHGYRWRPYKQIIAPDSQLHHEWIPKTAEYRGVALVEKEPHQYGIVDVIEILDGKITLLTEEEVRKGKKNEKEDI